MSARFFTAQGITQDQLCTFDTNGSGAVDVIDILAVLSAYNVHFDTDGCITEATVVDLGGFADALTGMVERMNSIEQVVDGLVAQVNNPAGNFVCQEGWGGGSCDADGRAPIITCETGTVSVQQEPNVFPHTLTAADIPAPQVRDTGPSYPGHTQVELKVAGSDGITVWTSAEPYASLFDFGTATLSDGLSINVDIDSITTFEYIATDFEGNTASCLVDVHVVDVDECNEGSPSHSCADNALCENLFNARGEFSAGTYNCTCPEGFTGDGYTLCESQSVSIGLRTGNLFVTEYMWKGAQAIDDGAGNYEAQTPVWDTSSGNWFDDYTWLSHDFAVGDLNEDGHDDLYIGSRATAAPKLAFGDGVGGWIDDQTADVVTWSVSCLACIASSYAEDLNGDGHLDLYLATGAGGCSHNADSCAGRQNYLNQWWLGDGTGSFTEVPQNIPMLQEDVKTTSAFFADFTGDGNKDVYHCNNDHGQQSKGNSFWIGDGVGTFTKGAYGPGIGGDQNENRGRADGGYGTTGPGASSVGYMMTSTAGIGDVCQWG
jgi:hypothetical protein